MAPIIVGDWQTLALQIIGYKANQGLEKGGTWVSSLVHAHYKPRTNVLVGGQPKNHSIFKIMSGYTVTREQLCEAKRNDFPCELVVLPVVGAAQSSESIRVS
jgi:hypothetical protein